MERKFVFRRLQLDFTFGKVNHLESITVPWNEHIFVQDSSLYINVLSRIIDAKRM